jgi:uncharacterized protein YxjI
MKQFYMKQKVFSFGEKYNIFDENQNLIYHVKGQVFSIKNKMDMFKDDQLLYHFERKLFRFLPEYTLFTPNGEVLATIKKNFTFFGGKLTIHSTFGEMEVTGQIMQRDFHVTKNGNEVMSIHKKWISWGDSYEISIMDDQQVSFYVALVILIDVIFHQSSSHSSSSTHHSH